MTISSASDPIASPVVPSVEQRSELVPGIASLRAELEVLKATNAMLQQRQASLEEDLYAARQLQQSLLPPIMDNDLLGGDYISKMVLQRKKVQVTGFYLPCESLSGDLYDVTEFTEGDFTNDPEHVPLGLMVADVAGHGVAAAFITAIYKALYYRLIHTRHDPAEVLEALNNELCDVVKTGHYITTVYTRFDPETRLLTYAGGGHPHPIVYRHATQTLERLSENGCPLVWFAGQEYPQATIMLNPNDKVIFFTDGITEMRNTTEELFGEDRLDALILEASGSSGQEFLDHIILALYDYSAGQEPNDDMCMAVLEVLG